MTGIRDTEVRLCKKEKCVKLAFYGPIHHAGQFHKFGGALCRGSNLSGRIAGAKSSKRPPIENIRSDDHSNDAFGVSSNRSKGAALD